MARSYLRWAPAAVLTVLVGCGGNTGSGGGTSDAAVDSSGSGSGGSVGSAAGGSGGSAGSSGTSSGGKGGGSQCPPECFVSNRCVAACGDVPREYGCCPCPPGTINVLSCGADQDGGAAQDAGSAGVSCDLRDVLCRAAIPSCPEGQVPSVEDSCYGPCAPIEQCVCTQPEECSDVARYTCHLFRSRCGPYL